MLSFSNTIMPDEVDLFNIKMFSALLPLAACDQFRIADFRSNRKSKIASVLVLDLARKTFVGDRHAHRALEVFLVLDVGFDIGIAGKLEAR